VPGDSRSYALGSLRFADSLLDMSERAGVESAHLLLSVPFS
jgi:hypothetical protein